MPRWRFGRFELLPDERRLLRDREPVRLGARAFDLLLALVAHRGRLVTKAELMDLAWPGLVVEESNVQVQMSALRKVLGADAVATIPGLGYRFAMAVEEVPLDGPMEGVVARGAAGDAASVTNLSAELEGPIGRDGELAALRALLDAHRLVTVVGPGGIGKTRVAQAAARSRVGAHAHGVWWVDLAPLSTAEQLAPGIAKAAGLPLPAGDTGEGLRRALAARDVLLVLDNCEHLATPLAALVQSVLGGAEGVRVLATSQEPLRLPGEQLFPLSSLAVASVEAVPPLARACAAVQLLARRAAAVDPHFAITDANAGDAAALCRALDGLPLAIEMAAARLPLLGFQGVRQQLAERLDRLRAAWRDVPARHASLRLTLDWSHSLLTPAQQVLLRRLSVFAGAFGLDAAQHTAAGGGLEAHDVLEALGGLAERSLVQRVAMEPPRWRLLETTRMYAAEKLDAAGEADATQRRHGDAMARLADDTHRRGTTAWLLDRLPDYDDMELAFDRACARADADVAAATVTALRLLDQLRGLFAASSRRVEAAYALLPDAPVRAQARLHRFIASCGWVTSPHGTRVASALRAVELWRRLDEPRELHGALAIAATESARAGDAATAERCLAEARALERDDWPGRVVAVRMIHEGWVAQYAGDARRHRASVQAALALCEREGERAMANAARVLLTAATLAAGDVDSAISMARDAAQALREAHQADYLGFVHSLLARGLLAAGRTAEAGEAAARALEFTPAGAAHHADLMLTIAALAASVGDADAAARLLGHAQAARPHEPAHVDRIDDRLRAEAQTAAQAMLGPTQAEALRTLGGRLSPDDADRLARACITRLPVLEPPSAHAGPSRPAGPRTGAASPRA